MTALLTVLLFGTAFVVAVWTIFASIANQLPRMRELLGQTAQPLPALVPTRVTVRYAAPARRPAPFPLRAAA
ncbi:hypothetical protein [Sphingomonas sp. KR3-1]|uniref:hypothetical protein n=1 Tax=Sphingomonas sp. KR3-1 TaxID=3156611 RepID=UPI0032B415DA